MQLKSNTLCWNPMEAYYFTCANEDYKWVHFSLNLYRKNEMRVNKSYHLFLPQSLYLWYEESGCSCKCAHGSCVRCTGCGLFTYRKGVCIRQLWQNNPNLSKKQRPQQVSVVWRGQGDDLSEKKLIIWFCAQSFFVLIFILNFLTTKIHCLIFYNSNIIII